MWIFQETLSAKKAWLIIGLYCFSWEMIKRILLHTNIFRSEALINPTMRILEELSRTKYLNSRRRSICDTVNAFRRGIYVQTVATECLLY
jgi:hypothetical protein